MTNYITNPKVGRAYEASCSEDDWEVVVYSYSTLGKCGKDVSLSHYHVDTDRRAWKYLRSVPKDRRYKYG